MGRPSRRLAVLVAVAATTATVCFTAPAQPGSGAVAAAPDPAVLGQWSEPFDLGGIAIHATLTRTGDVLMFQYVEGDPTSDHTSYIWTWNHPTGALRQAPIPYDRDLFCAGHVVLPNGHVFLAGGHDHNTGHQQDVVGIANTDTYRPVARTWTPGPQLLQRRWYPTPVAMPNGKILVFGGRESVDDPVKIVEEFDPAANTISQLPSTATRQLGSYPRMHLLANGKVVTTGPAQATLSFDPAPSTWAPLGNMQYGARQLGSSVLLPGGRRVLVVGGKSSATETPTGTAEILDTSLATPRWRYTGSLTHPRLDANAVILPDGQVLVVGGGARHPYGDPVLVPELYNPATERWVSMAPQQGSRMYHSTALLLPDGRVLSAGQDSGDLATSGEIFSPPYLFNGPRPTIASMPRVVRYGDQFRIATPNPANIRRVSLVRPGSVTHAVDFDQRYVGLRFSAAAGTLTVRAPGSASVAPPGYYMLFLVNRAGVPSRAGWMLIR
jgi:hypothetical protein